VTRHIFPRQRKHLWGQEIHVLPQEHISCGKNLISCGKKCMSFGNLATWNPDSNDLMAHTPDSRRLDAWNPDSRDPIASNPDWWDSCHGKILPQNVISATLQLAQICTQSQLIQLVNVLWLSGPMDLYNLFVMSVYPTLEPGLELAATYLEIAFYSLVIAICNLQCSCIEVQMYWMSVETWLYIHIYLPLYFTFLKSWSDEELDDKTDEAER
jgi:hypothetical protein